MKKCPKCKKPVTGHHVIWYKNGKKTHSGWLCSSCEHEWYDSKGNIGVKK